VSSAVTLTQLSVNVNKVATLRNTRHLGIPDPARAALLCLEAGCHGITVHPRPDERHIRPADVASIADVLRDFAGAEYNLEGNPFEGEFLDHVRRHRPDQATLVPDGRDVFTSNEGWNLRRADLARLAEIVREIRDLGARVSLFMDAGSPDLEKAAELEADRIELYTEPYAAAFELGTAEAEKVVAPFAETARQAQALGLGVNAGHDLNRTNLPLFLTRVPAVLEVSIGHALIADALELGLPATVRAYLSAIGRG
jgi:pyridoxine 5-phosphate synthase